MIFYSPSSGGFYDDRIHSQVPSDAVQISKEEYQQLLEGEASGLLIISVDGRPALDGPLAPTSAQQEQTERVWRDSALIKPFALRDRHRDQQDIGSSTTLTAEQFQELLVYMQALRDWPQSEQFPVTEYRPVAPPWIAEQHP